MLSNTCKYGIRAVIYLASNGGEKKKIGIKTISKDLGIPTPCLGKILQSLVKQKLLSSTKGPHGGFGLARPADKITLLDVVLIIDGRDVLDMCLIDLKTCKQMNEQGNPCPVHSRYVPIRNQIIELFENQKISDLVAEMDDNPEIKL